MVRGVGFKTFIAIGKEIGTLINVLRDNDGDYENNVVEARKDYTCFPNIRLVSSTDDKEFSLEPAMILANAGSEQELQAFAGIVLSTRTIKLFTAKSTFAEKLEFMVEWFKSGDGDGKGKKKVDAAIRIFETNERFKYPAFLAEVLNFA